MARSRKLDWITGWWTEVTASGPDWFTVSPFTTPMLQLVSDADLREHGDDVVVERVIGQYMLESDAGNDTSGIVHMRLVVRPEDPAAVVTPVWAAPITTSAMAEERFLWHKVHYLNNGTRQLAPDIDPEWSHLDCRVNRRLQELDRLVLIWQLMPFAAGVEQTYRCGAWIRVLISIG